MGAIIAVAGQVILGHSGRSLVLRGGSVTALTWAISERPRGKTSIVWTLLCVATNINVREILTLQERAGMVSLFMMSRHVAGKRGKAASAVTAAVRLRFSQEMEDTAFLDSASSMRG
jgi:hypothetical protein